MKFGTDEYSRYVEKNGERLAIEPWPYKRPIWARVQARYWVVRWHLARKEPYSPDPILEWVD